MDLQLLREVVVVVADEGYMFEERRAGYQMGFGTAVPAGRKVDSHKDLVSL